jgi:zinc/manganese transport system substrate-binding protein
LTAVKTKLQATSESTRALLAPILKSQDGPLVIEYHKEFAYYFQEFGISSFGSIEEKPGVPPSAGRIAEVALAAKKAGVRLVLAADYAPMKTLQRFSEISGIPLVIVPTMIQSSGAIKDYAQLQAHIAEAIAKHAGAPKSLPEQAG